jgi:hypothetical protein
MRRKHMRPIIATAIAALLIGGTVASAPAFAQASSHSGKSNSLSTSMTAGNHARPVYNYAGRAGVTPSKQRGDARSGQATYSGVGPHGAPLSPGGIGSAPNSFGGAGYNGPYGQQ